MKTPLRILFLAMMLCVQNFTAQAKALQPEQVFALYFKTFVQHDEKALTDLNAYLTPFMGAENTHALNLKNAHAEEVKSFTGMFSASLPEETASACKEEIEAYFSALLKNLEKTEYTVKKIKELPNEHAKGTQLTELTVSLRFSIPARLEDLKLNDLQKITPDELKNRLKTGIKAFGRSEKKSTAEQEFVLYQVKKDGKTYYWNGGPQAMAWKLNEMYLKSIN